MDEQRTSEGMFDSLVRDDDPFGGANLVDEEAVSAGYAAGESDGRKAGQEDGRELGVVRTWQNIQCSHPSLIPERSSKGVAALANLLANFPLHNPEANLKQWASGLGGVQRFMSREEVKEDTLAATGLNF
eukprot:gene21982-29043_t